MDKGTAIASGMTIGSLLGVVFMIRYILSPSSLPGDVLWTFHAASPTLGPLTISSVTGYLMFLDTSYLLFAIDCSRVVNAWTFKSPNQKRLFGPPVEYGQLQLIPSADNNGQLYAIFARNGSLSWNQSISATTSLSPVATVLPWPGSALFTNAVFFGYDSNYVSYNLTSMKLQWSTVTGGTVRNPPAFSSLYNLVIGGSGDSKLYALHVGNGSIKWSVALGGEVLTTPVVWSGVVYAACSDGSVNALSIATGTELWSANPSGGSAVRAPLALARGLIILGTDSGSIYAMSMTSGAVSWTLPIPSGGSISSIVANGNEAFASSVSGTVASVFLATGNEDWTFQTGDFSNSTSLVFLANSLILGGADITAVQTITPTP